MLFCTHTDFTRPILTYAHHDVVKGSVRPDHVIVYTGDYFNGRPELEISLATEPIKVIPKTPRDKLNPGSQIDCSKIYTIEHNLRVQFIGEFDPQSKGEVKAAVEAVFHQRSCFEGMSDVSPPVDHVETLEIQHKTKYPQSTREGQESRPATSANSVDQKETTKSNEMKHEHPQNGLVGNIERILSMEFSSAQKTPFLYQSSRLLLDLGASIILGISHGPWRSIVKDAYTNRRFCKCLCNIVWGMHDTLLGKVGNASFRSDGKHA